jgi:hypothetical protein
MKQDINSVYVDVNIIVHNVDTKISDYLKYTIRTVEVVEYVRV